MATYVPCWITLPLLQASMDSGYHAPPSAWLSTRDCRMEAASVASSSLSHWTSTISLTTELIRGILATSCLVAMSPSPG